MTGRERTLQRTELTSNKPPGLGRVLQHTHTTPHPPLHPGPHVTAGKCTDGPRRARHLQPGTPGGFGWNHTGFQMFCIWRTRILQAPQTSLLPPTCYPPTCRSPTQHPGPCRQGGLQCLRTQPLQSHPTLPSLLPLPVNNFPKMVFKSLWYWAVR